MSRSKSKRTASKAAPQGVPTSADLPSTQGPPSTAPAPILEKKADPIVAPVATVAMGFRVWLSAYRVEVILFAVTFVVLASFSSQRFLRQSAAPHFVYQAQAWLEGRLDLDPEVLPNLEDWACVRVVHDVKTRCEGQPLATDHWYVSFPPFPALLMLPFVALNGYQFNDTSFTVIIGALAVAFFYSLLRFLSRTGESPRSDSDNAALALTVVFGTLFFYCAIRGEVWFSAEVMGVGLTVLYVRNAVGARRPLLAGLFFSMATLTRTPLFFTGAFFLLECLCPGPTHRIAQLKALPKNYDVALRKIGLFALGAAPLAIAASAYNFARFGSLGEFGHRFLFNNRVNADIDQYGLFNVTYLGRNLESAFFMLPHVSFSPLRLAYDPNGLSLLLTMPWLLLLFVPKEHRRLQWPFWLTVAACALPGLLYQNNGYMQFGFRFSLDWMPYLVLLFAIGGWSFKNKWAVGLLSLAILVNFWGAVGFRGYTELVRHW